MSTKGKSEPTDEEIRQMMDFDGLLKAYQETKATTIKKQSTHGTKLIIGSVIIAASIYVSYIWLKNPSSKNSQAETIHNIAPTPSEKPTPSEAPMVQLDTSFKTTVKESTPSRKPSLSNAPKSVSKEEGMNEVQPHYINAEPINGFPDLYAYFDRELKYPVSATRDSIQGVESVAFVIDKNGNPSEIEILHSLGPDFDQEVLRILDHMPPWKPATLNGQPVPSKVSMPFTFRVKN